MSKKDNAQVMAAQIVNEAKEKGERLRAIAEQLGVSVERVESVQRQMVYRQQYNQRPEVKAKRQQYNRERAQIAKQVRSLLMAK